MLDDNKVINGSYGEVHHDGKWLTNMFKLSAEVELSYADVKVAGSRWGGSKLTGLKGTGSMSGYKITDELLHQISYIFDDRGGDYATELISKLDDPQAYGCERIRLKNVKFTKIPIIGWEVGSIIEEEWPFTFSGVEYLDKISIK